MELNHHVKDMFIDKRRARVILYAFYTEYNVNLIACLLKIIDFLAAKKTRIGTLSFMGAVKEQT
jgi:hypothetical protein